MNPCINLEEALKLSATFSLHSLKGGIPSDLLVPIPNQQFCEFKALEWGKLEENEREAFKTFYTEVGADLEDAVVLLNQGLQLDELSWQRITQSLKA